MFKQISLFQVEFFILHKEHCLLKGNIVECYLSSFNFKKQDFYYAHFYLILYFVTSSFKLNSPTGL